MIKKGRLSVKLPNPMQPFRSTSCDLDKKFDVFFSIAWNSDFDNPRYNLEGQLKNVDYTLDAMMTAKRLGCCKFLAIGSQAECGLVNNPIGSYTPDAPLTAYAVAKCEAYVKGCELCDKLGMDFYWPRLLSAYGLFDRPSTLIMSCIDACKKHDALAMTAAEQIWDYVYVDDVARVLRILVERGKPMKKYSIASGVGRPLREYIKIITDVYGYPELLNGIGKRDYTPNEVMYLVGDISELLNDTGLTINPDFEKHIREMKNSFVER